MSITERKLRVKFQNSISDKLKEIIGTDEVYFKVEESKELYKKLSTSEDIEDWDWVEEDVSQNTGHIKTTYPDPHPNSMPSCSTTPRLNSILDVINFLKLTNYQELAIFIKATWGVSMSLEYNDPNTFNRIAEVYLNIKDNLLRSFDILGVKTFLESEYALDIERCKKEISDKMSTRWNLMKQQQTYLTAFTELFSKV